MLSYDEQQAWNEMQQPTHAFSELGHAGYAESADGSELDVRLARSDIGHGHSTIPYGIASSPAIAYRHSAPGARVARSDIGHGSSMSAADYAAGFLPSSSSLYVDNSFSIDGRMKASYSTQSATTLRTNTGLDAGRHRPRKLRKSLRSGQDSDSAMAARFSLASLPPPSAFFGASSQSKQQKSQLSLSLSMKLAPRPARKLTKRPSTGTVPPTPVSKTNSMAPTSSDLPPPVPPKPQSILKIRIVSMFVSLLFISLNSSSKPTPPESIEEQRFDAHLGSTIPPSLVRSPDSGPQSEELVTPPNELIAPVAVAVTTQESDALARTQRPSFLRTESNRRWTVAVAEVPDEMFMEELERLRRMGLRAGEVHGSDRHAEKKKTEAGGAAITEEVEDDSEWIDARRAILCCRELVRTERSYQARLQELADGNVSSSLIFARLGPRL